MSSDFRPVRLEELLQFANGRSSPDRDEAAMFPVFGSNGRIGMAAKSNSPSRTVVIGRVGTYCGSVHFSKQACWVTDNAIRATAKDDNDPEFLYYLLKHLNLNNWRSGSGQPLLNQGTLNAISTLVPAPPIQRRISSLIGAIDDRITLLRETNATLEAIAQALFKSWFVEFDPVRSNMASLQHGYFDAAVAALFPDDTETTEHGEIPESWHFAPLREMVHGVYDGPHATPPEAHEGGVFLGIKNLTGTSLDLSDVRHISEADWSQWTKRVTPRHGDIVFSYEATLGFFAMVPPGLRCCLGRRLALVRPLADSGTPHFWFHQFVAAPFQRLLDKHTIQGATVNRIALKSFPDLPVLVPPLELREAFERVAAPIWLRIHENSAQAMTLVRLRDTLLPRLISGQLRLPLAETEVEVA
ncbi:restriction endonuclease subunit S [Paucibacter sp. KCTC 42545]|uniref:restriction endonuclease subunit S n=1 Tax=Paucibacter sp. KCTC 42545 TaxID=1768242 RepID=UPI000733BF63|nr:restriction endonuclease subunit S [Paucibacter sp. KCTC 42545]ALT77930.1 hypothetical protein AT984_12830 [Paucibacter sp. KCTC 42545]